ncbi:hypothetical protein [Streptomyces sp. NPDC005533]|uniref:hypothetical protein n=1 Tax=Streptomyces sp. NPDC005533 TaxID=3364723 RepID=UPI0036B9016B
MIEERQDFPQWYVRARTVEVDFRFSSTRAVCGMERRNRDSEQAHADDPERAEIWELGYLSGFQDPSGSDFLPLSQELLEVYTQGVDAGRDDNAQSPTTWLPRSDLEGESSDEWIEHIVIEGIARVAEHIYKKEVFGLIGLVIAVLGIPTDTPMHPLEDDFLEPYTGPDDDPNVTFIAMCPRTDHPMPAIGTTVDGYWTGAPMSDFGDALKETLDRGHRESGVARCSTTDNTYGLVWAAAQ